MYIYIYQTNIMWVDLSNGVFWELWSCVALVTQQVDFYDHGKGWSLVFRDSDNRPSDEFAPTSCFLLQINLWRCFFLVHCVPTGRRSSAGQSGRKVHLWLSFDGWICKSDFALTRPGRRAASQISGQGTSDLWLNWIQQRRLPII